MYKTSVYLTEDEAEELRLAAATTGRSQSDLIREGVRSVVADAIRPQRVFHSMGVGRGKPGGAHHWTSDELYEKVMGRRWAR